MVFPVLPVGDTTLLPTTSQTNASSGLATQTVGGAGTATLTGAIIGLAGAAGTVQWTGTIESTQATSFIAADGPLPAVYQYLDSDYTVPTDPDLLADGFDDSGGLAIINTLDSTLNVTTTLSYGFSSALPGGTSFALWDPGSSYEGVGGPFTFSFTAADGAASVSPANWTYQLVNPFTGEVLSGTYAYNSTTGTLTVTKIGGSDANLPREVLIVTPNTPVTDFTVTATTQQQDFFGLTVIAPATTGQTTDTVVGVGGTTFAISFAAARDAAAVAPYLDNLTASVSGGSVTIYSAAQPNPATGSPSAVQEATTSFLGAMGKSQGFISNATGGTTLFGGSNTNESIITGAGGLFFTPTPSVTGGGQIHGGGGNNVFFAANVNAGNWNITFGGGNDTVVAAAGNDTVDAGTGANLEFLGTGNATVTSEGADTIVGGSGTLEADGLGPGALVFALTGAMNFVAAAGANTVVGNGAETLQGGGGTILSFSFGPTQYIGGSGADTIAAVDNAAGAGALTASGGSGNSLYFGAASGGNNIYGGTGSATIFGGGAGDRLSTGGSGLNVVAAAQGAETIDASKSSGQNTIFLGSGADSVTGGSGASAYQIGTGTATITGGASNLYVFYNLVSTTRTLEITNFNPATDQLKLNGYAAGAAASTAASELSIKGGGTLVTLPDGTKITFDGVSHVSSASFT